MLKSNVSLHNVSVVYLSLLGGVWVGGRSSCSDSSISHTFRGQCAEVFRVWVRERGRN